jgi:hypothetical protein
MNEQEKAAQAAGAAAAEKVIRAQASAGVSTDRIEAHGADTASWLFSEAKTADGRAFAAGYDDTAQALVAELREAALPASDRWPSAPHPDPFLAQLSWQACEHGDGIYLRRTAAQHEIDREVG